MNSEPSLVPCPACRSVLPVPAEQLGKAIRCGQCNEVFDTARAAPAPSIPADDNPFSIPSSSTDRDDDEPPRPKARKEESKKIGTPVIVGAAIAGLLVLGGAGLGIRYALQGKETAKATEPTAKAKEQPKPKEKDKPKEPALGPDGKMADDVREKVKGSSVYIRTFFENGKAATGSGFFAVAPGYVVTNSHVIGQTEANDEPVRKVQVVINSGQPDARTFEAKVLKADRSLDLAPLKIDIPANAPPPLEVIDSFKLKETQEIYIFGFPGGESIGAAISVNISSISSFRREGGASWIQVAGGMHPGNSGGPVTDAFGRVIGVARAGIRGTNINVAIPGDTVHNFFHNAGDLLPKK